MGHGYPQHNQERAVVIDRMLISARSHSFGMRTWEVELRCLHRWIWLEEARLRIIRLFGGWKLKERGRIGTILNQYMQHMLRLRLPLLLRPQHPYLLRKPLQLATPRLPHKRQIQDHHHQAGGPAFEALLLECFTFSIQRPILRLPFLQITILMPTIRQRL